MRRIKFPTDLLIFSLFPGLYFFIAIFSKVDLGERHILLVYPFALLFVASVWHYAREKRARSPGAPERPWCWVNVVDTLRYAPGYLSYFTPFVNPATSWKLLSDSNLDWGQGLSAASRLPAHSIRMKPCTSLISVRWIPSSMAFATRHWIRVSG